VLIRAAVTGQKKDAVVKDTKELHEGVVKDLKKHLILQLQRIYKGLALVSPFIFQPQKPKDCVRILES